MNRFYVLTDIETKFFGKTWFLSQLCILILIIVILDISPSTFAKTQGVFTNTGISGRSSVFGESFVAIADDASAIHWNPAGISKLTNRCNITASRINLFSGLTGFSDVNYNFLSFVFSDHPWGVGISLDCLGTDEIIKSNKIGNVESLHLSYAEYKVSTSGSLRYRKLGSFGFSVHHFRIPTETYSNDWSTTLGLLSNNLLRDKWSMKAGEKYECWLRFGVTARNVVDTIDSPTRQYTIASTFGGGFEKKGMFNVATAYSRGVSKNSSKWVASMEYGWGGWGPQYGVDFNIYGGFEYYPNTGVKFWKAGGEIGRGIWRLNYSFEQHSFLKNTHRLALNLRWSRHETAVFIRKLHEDQEVDTGNKFETTDNIIIHIDVSDDVQIESVKAAQPKLICFERIGAKQLVEKLEKSYQDMQMEDQHHIHYILKPMEYQFYPATYIVSVYARGRKLKSAEFSLSYSQRAEQLVGEAYNSFVQGDFEKAKSYLLDVARVEKNYPNVYYIAGLISEARDDFEGAQKCYLKASELSGGRKIRHLETEVNPKDFAASDYLRRYAETQKRQRRQGIRLYEELERIVSPR